MSFAQLLSMSETLSNVIRIENGPELQMTNHHRQDYGLPSSFSYIYSFFISTFNHCFVLHCTYICECVLMIKSYSFWFDSSHAFGDNNSILDVFVEASIRLFAYNRRDFLLKLLKSNIEETF